MTVQQLRTVQGASPFRPYTLQLADGSEVHVRHPELVAIAPSGRTLAVAASEDAFKIIDLLLVTAIDVDGGPPQRRRRK